MSREITLAKEITEDFGHIKDVRLKESGYLYISDYYKVEGNTTIDMVILQPEEVKQLKELLNEDVTNKVVIDKEELKNIIDNKVEDIFVEIVKRHNLPYGDMDVLDYNKLETIKEDLLKVAVSYLKINLPSEEE